MSAASVRLQQTLEPHALQRALQEIVNRHAALRTTFAETEHGPVQQVRAAADVAFVTVDAAGWDEETLQAAVRAALYERFDLATGPLLRTTLFSRTPTDHVLLCAFHHIVTDGWSIGLFLDELTTLYAAEVEGKHAGLAQPQHQYPDYAQWQAQMLAGDEGERLRSFWLERLRGDLPLLELPTDRPRPARQSFRGASTGFNIEDELLASLRALAHDEQTTLFVVLLAGFQLLLHRLSGQDDIIVGTPLGCRAHLDFQRTIGYFANAMPLRAAFAQGLTFRALLHQTRATLLEALEHQDYPFALLVEQLKPRRTAGRMAVFEASFNHLRLHVGADSACPCAGRSSQTVLQPIPTHAGSRAV